MKLFLLISFALFFMDPCHVRPHALKISEVNEMCRSDHPTKYVKIRGSVLNRGEVVCGDMPGGVHCELFFGDPNRHEYVRVFVKAGKSEPGKTRQNGVSFQPPADWDGIKFVAAPFDSLTLFDKDGARLDLAKEEIDISGTLRWDDRTQDCTQGNIQLIERAK